jgi:hypothetical protein
LLPPATSKYFQRCLLHFTVSTNPHDLYKSRCSLPLYILICSSFYPAYAQIFFWTFWLEALQFISFLHSKCHCLRP